MYYKAITQLAQALKNLEAWLDIADKHAAAKKFDVGILLNSRLAPDMKDLVYQIQSACDYVKGGAAWLSGQKPPRHEDTERTLGEVRDRIHKTIAFVEGVDESAFSDAAAQKIQMSWVPGKVLNGADYLFQMIVPSVYFHLCAAYMILRHNGVDLGKMDYLGPTNYVEGMPTVR